MYKAQKEQISVFGLRSQYGGGKTTGFALVYDSPEAMKKFEPTYRLVRVGQATKVERAAKQQRTSCPPSRLHVAPPLAVREVLTPRRQAAQEPSKEAPRHGQGQGCQAQEGEISAYSVTSRDARGAPRRNEKSHRRPPCLKESGPGLLQWDGAGPCPSGPAACLTRETCTMVQKTFGFCFFLCLCSSMSDESGIKEWGRRGEERKKNTSKKNIRKLEAAFLPTSQFTSMNQMVFWGFLPKKLITVQARADVNKCDGGEPAACRVYCVACRDGMEPGSCILKTLTFLFFFSKTCH